jgi:hypothetical protein
MTMTTNRTAQDLARQIKDIELAAFGMNVPLNAGQLNRIAQLREELAAAE